MSNPPTDAPPAPPARPSFALPPRGPPLGLPGAGMLKPKAAPKKFKFVERDLSEASLGEKQWKMTIAERMRYLDDARKHSPLSDECAFLNIPEGRLDLHTLKSILYVCGGCAGARFSTNDFTLAKDLIATMEKVWNEMESAYKALSAAQRKVVLDQPYIISPPSPSTGKEEEEGTNDNNTDTEKTEKSAGDTDSGSDEEEEEEPAPLPDDVDAGVVGFHRLADQWCRLANTMQDLVKVKQSSLPTAEERKALIASFAASDPDGLDKAKSMPDWLETLLAKYKCEGVPKVQESVSNLTLNIDGKPPTPLQANPDTIGKVSCYVSFMVMGAIPTGEGAEQTALREVLQASNDRHRVLTNEEHLEGIIERERNGQGQGQTYWAQRLYNFLSKVRELKGMVKEEKALTYPHIWVA